MHGSSVGSAQFDEPIARLNQRDDLVDQWLEPSQQRGASCVANTYPHDGGSVTAEGRHVGEVLILGHDDRPMFKRVAPQVAIGRLTQSDVIDVLGDVRSIVQQPCQCWRQLGVDQKTHRVYEAITTAWSAWAAAYARQALMSSAVRYG